MSNTKLHKVYNRSSYSVVLDGVVIAPHKTQTFTDIQNKTELERLVASGLIQYSEEDVIPSGNSTRRRSKHINVPKQTKTQDTSNDNLIGDDE